ncbi:hypothetical protein [Pyruvatibacter mobilis]|uniref:hypothetical protein n=1 Tax=Pyruvatibacter mobilis TaxID=1712261 RepID=UPI00145257C1|nr:hypothetical protein [Pyruvatibacter mobilis]QJD76693.1 hypothetical protein HG718_00010 [Pyruvatibacter mobilis]GGD02644.1 hypothetical protein GCM10011587_02910 [Pyruvatibacter mobilis]
MIHREDDIKANGIIRGGADLDLILFCSNMLSAISVSVDMNVDITAPTMLLCNSPIGKTKIELIKKAIEEKAIYIEIINDSNFSLRFSLAFCIEYSVVTMITVGKK